jgi:hypothetical protein
MGDPYRRGSRPHLRSRPFEWHHTDDPIIVLTMVLIVVVLDIEYYEYRDRGTEDDSRRARTRGPRHDSPRSLISHSESKRGPRRGGEIPMIDGVGPDFDRSGVCRGRHLEILGSSTALLPRSPPDWVENAPPAGSLDIGLVWLMHPAKRGRDEPGVR